MKKKVGIITFHNSYNCGSMLESYAIHQYLMSRKINNEIINFSNEGQRELYSIFCSNTSIKNIIKNIISLIHIKQLKKNEKAYKLFQTQNFILSEEYYDSSKLNDENYSIVVAGSDQIWNITIDDYDKAYFLPWVKNARKVAYAPSFGAKNILTYSRNSDEYKLYLSDFDALSVRENNGKKWIYDLIQKDVEVLIDPTLLLNAEDYEKIMDTECKIPSEYIFFYCPTFDKEICKFVKKISKKYKLPVITWGAKKYYLHGIRRFGFKLAEKEDPSMYLKLIKNAKLVITTSFHGTIFSTIFEKKFYTIKNGEMYGNDDRVLTLVESLGIKNRLIPFDFDITLDYLEDVDYTEYYKRLPLLKAKAKVYIERNIEKYYNETIE